MCIRDCIEIVKFFQTGVPPIPPDETLEIMAFLEAGLEQGLRRRGGGAQRSSAIDMS